ncbi:MAG: hypothetical protein HZB16_23430 [Armatimonadetes bacterium]|nr:hypothetical protein [Armatimonadota bacterium]
MRATLRQVLVIARLTAADALRSPLYHLVWLTALCVAGTLPLLDYLALHEKRRLVVDSLLALALTGGSLLGILLAADGVGGEVRRGTLALLRTRGAEPAAWLGGKLLGLAAALLPFAFTLGLAVIFGSRVAAQPFHNDAMAARGWWLALLGATALWAGSRGRLRLAWLLPLSLALAFALLRGGWERDDLAVLPAVVGTGCGMVLAAWVAAVLALAVDVVTTVWLGVVIFLVGVAADSWLTGAGRLLWLVGPSWSLFQQTDAGWPATARAAGYLLAYGLALVAFGAGLRAAKEPR